MRRAPLCAALLLASCGGETGNGAAAPAPGAPDNLVECRLGDAEPYRRICSVETFDGDDGRVLTVRKPDGGFRRLRVTADGRSLVAADGAERARVATLADGRIEVSIGDDHFRLPAAAARQ